MEVKVIKEDQDRVYMYGPEVCREYTVTGKITFGSSTLLPGQTGGELIQDIRIHMRFFL